MLRQTSAFSILQAHQSSFAQPSRALANAPQFLRRQVTKPTNVRCKPLVKSSYQTRPFTASHYYRAGQYNRFNGQQPVFPRLLEAAKPRHFVFLGLGISGLYLYNTDEVELTGRRRFNCVSHARELKMGTESYREILNSERGKILPTHHPLTKMVDGVLQRLIPGIEIEGADWKVHVIKDDENINAFVLPG